MRLKHETKTKYYLQCDHSEHRLGVSKYTRCYCLISLSIGVMKLELPQHVFSAENPFHMWDISMVSNLCESSCVDFYKVNLLFVEPRKP